MVKSYTRFEAGVAFGIVSSPCSIIGIEGNIVAVGADEAINIWDIKTGERVNRLVDPQQSPRAQVVHLAFEHQSKLIGAGYTDGSIRVWDYTSGECLITFTGHRTSISSLVFDESGTRLISGSHDTTIIVWDLVGEQGLYRLKGHKSPVTGLLLLNGEWLISTAKDGVMKLWDLETQFGVETHIAHKGECWSIANCGENKFITAGVTTEMRLWDVNLQQPDGQKITGAGVLEKQSKHRTTGIIYDSKHSTLAVASGDAVQLWKQRTADELKKALKRKEKRALKKGKDPKPETDLEVGLFLPHSITRTRAKITGLSLGVKRDTFLVNLGNNSVESWAYGSDEPARQKVIESPGHRSDVRDLAVSYDSMLIASGSNGLIKIHNAKSRKCIRTLEDTGYVLSLHFLPGDSLVVSVTKEGTLDIYDISRCVKVVSVQAHEGAAWSLDVSRDGKTLVTGGADKMVKLWAVKVSDDKMEVQNTHKLEFPDDVLAVKLSPDNRLLAAALLDNTVKVYYRETLKFFLNLYGHQLPVLSMDISHDSKILITSSADKNIKIWGLDFGDCHKSIFAHDDSVLRVLFEPETHNFVSASKDGLIKYWDGDKFIQIQRLQGHHSEVWALATALDGSYIVSASHDRSMRVWEMTDEPLFIEEERENELEQQYEENLVDSLDRDADRPSQPQGDEDAPEGDEAGTVTKHTIDSLKAGERLYEALEIAIQSRDPAKKDTPHIILTSLGVTGERYLMDVLSKIKPSLVEDALLTFTLDRISHLLVFVQIWLEKGWNLPVVCRVLFFCLRSFHKQLVGNRMLRSEFEAIRDQLRSRLQQSQDIMGYNYQRLSAIQTAWSLDHVHSFEDLSLEPSSVKRGFSSITL